MYAGVGGVGRGRPLRQRVGVTWCFGALGRHRLASVFSVRVGPSLTAFFFLLLVPPVTIPAALLPLGRPPYPMSCPPLAAQELACVRIAIVPAGSISDARFLELAQHVASLREVSVNALPRRNIPRHTPSSSSASGFSTIAVSTPSSRPPLGRDTFAATTSAAAAAVATAIGGVAGGGVPALARSNSLGKASGRRSSTSPPRGGRRGQSVAPGGDGGDAAPASHSGALATAQEMVAGFRRSASRSTSRSLSFQGGGVGGAHSTGGGGMGGAGGGRAADRSSTGSPSGRSTSISSGLSAVPFSAGLFGGSNSNGGAGGGGGGGAGDGVSNLAALNLSSAVGGGSLEPSGADGDACVSLRYDIVPRDASGNLVLLPSSEWDLFHSSRKVWGVIGVVDCTPASLAAHPDAREAALAAAKADFAHSLSLFRDAAEWRVIVFSAPDVVDDTASFGAVTFLSPLSSPASAGRSPDAQGANGAGRESAEAAAGDGAKRGDRLRALSPAAAVANRRPSGRGGAGGGVGLAGGLGGVPPSLSEGVAAAGGGDAGASDDYRAIPVGYVPETPRAQETAREVRAQVIHFAGLVLSALEAWIRLVNHPTGVVVSPLDMRQTLDKQSKLAKRRLGRLDKWLGDYFLLIGSPSDALTKYNSAVERSRANSDRLWLAGATEGAAAALALSVARRGPPKASLVDRIIEQYSEVYKLYQKKRVTELEVSAALRLANYLADLSTRRREAIAAAAHAAAVGESLRPARRATLWAALATLHSRLGCSRRAALFLYRLGRQNAKDGKVAAAHALIAATANQFCSATAVSDDTSLPFPLAVTESPPPRSADGTVSSSSVTAPHLVGTLIVPSAAAPSTAATANGAKPFGATDPPTERAVRVRSLWPALHRQVLLEASHWAREAGDLDGTARTAVQALTLSPVAAPAVIDTDAAILGGLLSMPVPADMVEAHALVVTTRIAAQRLPALSLRVVEVVDPPAGATGGEGGGNGNGGGDSGGGVGKRDGPFIFSAIEQRQRDLAAAQASREVTWVTGERASVGVHVTAALAAPLRVEALAVIAAEDGREAEVWPTQNDGNPVPAVELRHDQVSAMMAASAALLKPIPDELVVPALLGPTTIAGGRGGAPGVGAGPMRGTGGGPLLSRRSGSAQDLGIFRGSGGGGGVSGSGVIGGGGGGGNGIVGRERGTTAAAVASGLSPGSAFCSLGVVPQRPAAVRILGVALRLFHGVLLVLRAPDMSSPTPPPPVRVIPPLSAMAICATPATGADTPAGPPPVAPSPPPPLSLFVGERRTLVVRVENVGALPVESAMLRLSSSDPDVVRLSSVLGASSLDGPIPPGAVRALSFDVVADLGPPVTRKDAVVGSAGDRLPGNGEGLAAVRPYLAGTGGGGLGGGGGAGSSLGAGELASSAPARIGSEDSTSGRDGSSRATQRTVTVTMAVEHSADATRASHRLLRESAATLTVVVRPALVVEAASAVALCHRMCAVSPGSATPAARVAAGGPPPLALCLQVYNLASVVLHVRLVRRGGGTSGKLTGGPPEASAGLVARSSAEDAGLLGVADGGGGGGGDVRRPAAPSTLRSCLVEHGGSVRLLAPLDPPTWTDYSSLGSDGGDPAAPEARTSTFLHDAYALAWDAPSLGRSGTARLRVADSSGVGREATRLDASLVAALHRPGVSLAFVVDDERRHLLPLGGMGGGGVDGCGLPLDDSDDDGDGGEGGGGGGDGHGLSPPSVLHRQATSAGARRGSCEADDDDVCVPAGVVLSTRRYHTIRFSVAVTDTVALPPGAELDVRLGQADLRGGFRPVDSDGAVAFVTGALHGVPVGGLEPGATWDHAVRLRFESEGVYVLDATLRLGGSSGVDGGWRGGGMGGDDAAAAGASPSRGVGGLGSALPASTWAAGRRRRGAAGDDGVIGRGRSSGSGSDGGGGRHGGARPGAPAAAGAGGGVSVHRRLAIRAAAPPGYGAWAGARPTALPALLRPEPPPEQPPYDSVVP